MATRLRKVLTLLLLVPFLAESITNFFSTTNTVPDFHTGTCIQVESHSSGFSLSELTEERDFNERNTREDSTVPGFPTDSAFHLFSSLHGVSGLISCTTGAFSFYQSLRLFTILCSFII